MKKLLIICLVAIGCQTAHAQFGNLLNRAKYSAQSSLENAVTKGVNDMSKSALDSAKKKLKKAKKGKAEETVWSYGDHRYTMKGNLSADKYRKDGFGEVTFTNVPSDYNEFEALYSEFLGRTPHGTAAMMVMAMEMYARDREVGKKCIELICCPSNVNSVIPRLKDKFGAQPGDSYGQRYLPAAVLQGATPANGYRPNRPYTVEMDASVNKHQELKIVGSGTVMYIYIIGGGWDTQQRQVEIILEPGHEQYQVFNCPSLYTQCKQIQGEWGGLE